MGGLALMKTALSKAAAILREFSNEPDEKIVRQLAAAGIDRVAAARLVEFLPMWGSGSPIGFKGN